jgi:hypothetical protein
VFLKDYWPKIPHVTEKNYTSKKLNRTQDDKTYAWSRHNQSIRNQKLGLGHGSGGISVA